jgi:flagellar biosynthesis/type III secretory pathway chaperone
MSARTRPARPDLARMLVLLEQEKHALTQGDMPGLIRLAPRKEAVLARLDTATPALNGGDGALAQQVQRDAARNARLFEAALRGLKDARALIDRYKGRRGDQTYARDGERKFVDQAKSTLEKRA